MLNVSQRATIIHTFCSSRIADLSGMSRPFFSLTLKCRRNKFCRRFIVFISHRVIYRDSDFYHCYQRIEYLHVLMTIFFVSSERSKYRSLSLKL